MTPSSDLQDPAPGKGRLWTVLRLVFGATVLALVARSLPWSDELRHVDAEGAAVSVEGTIEGDWKQPMVAFRVTDAASLEPDGPAWPKAFRAASERGESLDVERRAGGDVGGYEWDPSVQSLFRSIDTGGLALGMGILIAASLLTVVRWWRLLALAGCATTWFNALRLTYIGFCFNLIMPGMTGGDLVKGVLAAKENPERRADAVVSVVIDRLIGLAALALLAMVVILLSGDTFEALRLPILAVLGAGAVGAGLYAAKPLRKALGFTWLMNHLPLADKLRKLDSAALHYLKHPVPVALAFLLSFANHLMVCLSVFVLGRALGVGESAGLREFLVVAPVANMVAAIPISPGGWGLGEFAYKQLFEMIGISGALGVAVSVTFRLCNQVGLGALGSLFLLLPGVRADVRETRGKDTH